MMRGENISYRIELKYLGVHMSAKLTFKKFAQEIRNMVREVSGLESQLLFGSMGTVTKDVMELTTGTGQPLSQNKTTTQVLFDELNETKVTEVMKERVRNTFGKLADYPREPLKELVNYKRPLQETEEPITRPRIKSENFKKRIRSKYFFILISLITKT